MTTKIAIGAGLVPQAARDSVAETVRNSATDSVTKTVRAEPATRTRPSAGDGDHDRFAHYIRKSESTRAYVEGTPVQALCGKVWVPSRDPSRYPTCPTCTEIRKRLVRRADN